VKQSRRNHNNQPPPTSSLPSPSSSVSGSIGADLESSAEAADEKAEEGKTSEGASLSAATLRGVSSREGVRKRSLRWVSWHKKKRAVKLRQAAEEELSAVRHDTSQLVVVSALVDGRWCKDVLVDPGASSNFVRQDWVKGVGLPMKRLHAPLEVTLADGKVGAKLTHAVQVNSLETQGSSAPCMLTVMEQLSHQVILGLPWLRKAGVTIDYEHMKWNGHPLCRMEGQGEGGTELLQAIVVAPEHEKRMAALLKAYPMAFSKELRQRSAEDVGKAIKCCIVLKDPNCRPIKCRERRRSPKDEAALRTAVEEMLAKGLVRPSKSEWVSQPVLVKKVKDGVVLDEKRPCWDYRFVNNCIKGDAFPLPLPENMFDALQGSRIFSKLDLTKGFWQIPLDEVSKAILAMSTPLGLMEPNHMPFGMKNAPSVFQREMQRVLCEKLGKGLFVFVDDILIYSKTVEEHEEMVAWVLRRLCEEGYYANPDKCEFFQKEVSFLGHIINEKGISVQQHKVKAVNEWPQPKTRKDVKSFLGLTGYYRKFVHGYSKIALPLTELTKTQVTFVWGEEQQKAFDELKAKLTSAPVLAHPDPSRQYILHTDASGFATAAVLSQQQEDGTIRPVAYYSKKMGPAERNYGITDKELLAIVQAVRHWRCYLEGNPYPVKVLTDHQALKWLSSKADVTGRQMRWVQDLSDVEYEVSYIPGPQNAAADALSRRTDMEEKGTEQHTPSSAIVEPIARLKIHVAAVQGSPTVERPLWESRAEFLTLKNELRKAAEADPWYREKMQQTSPTDGLLRGDGLLWTIDGRFYVPADREVQRKLLYELHDAPTGGHLGERKTLHKLQKTCYWPGMRKDVEDYVKGCTVCAAVKPSQQMPAGLLQPLPIPHRPWEVISIDFVGPLVRTKDYHDSILVVVDKFSKMGHFIPTSTGITSEKTARLLINSVIKLHGLPSSIISDRDPRFIAGMWKEVFTALGVKLGMSSSYHPQTDGQTERLNRTLEAGLRAYADKKGADWADWLPMCEAFYNSSTHSSTGKTPFEMNGVVWSDAVTYAMRSPTMDGVKSQSAEDVLHGMKEAWEDARLMLMASREKMKENADRGRREERYAVGDRVLLSTKHLSRASSKLNDPFVGPFTITRVSDHGVNVWLDLPADYRRLHQPFHIEKVKRYTPSAIEWGRKQNDRPLPELVDGQQEWEVEMILGKRQAEELVEVQPELSEPGDDQPSSTEEVKEEAGPVRRSSRVAARGAPPVTNDINPARRKPRRVRQLVTRYLVKWKGYGEEEATWEREDSLRLHAQDAIDEYEYRQTRDRGEESVGVQCIHTLKEEEGSLTLSSMIVGGQ
jgi:transposase InsO family protein